MPDSYVRFLDEAKGRWNKALCRLNDNMLDAELPGGMMKGMVLISHCFVVVGYVFGRLGLEYVPGQDDIGQLSILPRLVDGKDRKP